MYQEAAVLIHDLPLMTDLGKQAALQALADIPQQSPRTEAQAAATAAYAAVHSKASDRQSPQFFSRAFMWVCIGTRRSILPAKP